MPQIIWAGQSGCLLPLLIILNLFFGRLIFSSIHLWLAVEAALILVFIIKINSFMQKIKQQFFSESESPTSDSRIHRSGGKVIDVEGRVIEEKQIK